MKVAIALSIDSEVFSTAYEQLQLLMVNILVLIRTFWNFLF